MAIQKQKAPSPSEITSGPQSFTEKELKELRELRYEMDQIILQFGQVEINKIKLSEAESLLKKQLSDLEKKEKNVSKKLSDKYGVGSINLDSGTFTPSK